MNNAFDMQLHIHMCRITSASLTQETHFFGHRPFQIAVWTFILGNYSARVHKVKSLDHKQHKLCQLFC